MADLAASHAFGRPEHLVLGERMLALRFDLMKYTPARHILDMAARSGVLAPGGRILESSSGTFALALAILSSLRGYALTLVTGPVSSVVRWRLESLGATLRIVPASRNCEGGIQQARLEVLHDLLAEDEDAFWPRQYTNPLNAASYAPIARDVAGTTGRIDAIVGAVGSGGSLFGMADVLRETNPDLRVVAVDHVRSVIFGARPERISAMDRETFEQILAMGAGIPMGNVAFTACDEVHWVPIPKMVREVHRFHGKTGHLVGPSSGAALAVAGWLSRRHPDWRVLVLLPDHGVRYVETLFDPRWLERWEDDLAYDRDEPLAITTPLAVTDGWCVLDWKRRSFEDLLGHPPAPREKGWNP